MDDWGDLLGVSNARPVWKGTLRVVDEPPVFMWWQAWMALDGGFNTLQVGVTGWGDAEEVQELVHRVLGGVLDMAWRTVGESLPIETVPVAWRRSPVNDRSGFSGKVVVKAGDGRAFDPFIKAVTATKEAV